MINNNSQEIENKHIRQVIFRTKNHLIPDAKERVSIARKETLTIGSISAMGTNYKHICLNPKCKIMFICNNEELRINCIKCNEIAEKITETCNVLLADVVEIKECIFEDPTILNGKQ